MVLLVRQLLYSSRVNREVSIFSLHVCVSTHMPEIALLSVSMCESEEEGASVTGRRARKME